MRAISMIFAVAGVVLCQGPRGDYGEGMGPGGPDGRGGPGGVGGFGGMDGRGPPPFGPRPPPPPPYLHNLTSEAQMEYFDIMRNMTLTIADQKQQVLDWGKKYNIENEVQEFEADMTRVRQEVKQNVTQLISELADAYNKLSALMDNEDQTLAELSQAIHNLTQENPPVYRVLQFATDLFMRPPPGTFPPGSDFGGVRPPPPGGDFGGISPPPPGGVHGGIPPPPGGYMWGGPH
ncbi:hypothetical protein OESDEN_05405 [Oesophagostomum dentatum]|uniref:SXP/RAL-2 family protein Ani s 5-like cation-binding domain-containing protein n=1 Tax=Oesophagostomum dentatum TaxID=61180 RepID=A0A0B1TFU4_OESDE|nr:hypothetical protein OESDEN_05405 [Oesophagostomum dentatum]